MIFLAGIVYLKGMCGTYMKLPKKLKNLKKTVDVSDFCVIMGYVHMVFQCT